MKIVWIMLGLSAALGGCIAPHQQGPVVALPPSAGAPAASPAIAAGRRIVYHGGVFVLPDGSTVGADPSGGFTLPNGSYATPDGAGGIVLPNGTPCGPDGARGYVCP